MSSPSKKKEINPELLLQLSSNAIVILDKNARFFAMNHLFAKLTGYATDALIGKKYSDYIYKDDQSRTNQFIHHIISNQKKSDFHTRLVSEKGEPLAARLSALYDNESELIYLSLNEISANDFELNSSANLNRKQHDRFLTNESDSKSCIQNIFNNFPDALVLINKQREILFSNWLAISLYQLKTGDKFSLMQGVPLKNGYHQVVSYKNEHNNLINLDIYTVVTEECNGQAYLLVIRDITVTLVQQQQFLFAMQTVENMVDLIYWADEDGRLLHANQAACATMGYSYEEFCRMHIWNVRINFGAEQWREMCSKVKAGLIKAYRTQHKTKSGKVLDIDLSINFFELSGKTFFIANCKDISSELEYEKKLKWERNFSQIILQEVQVILVTLNKDGIITSINPYGCRLLGYSAEELLGENWFTMCLPQSQETEQVYQYFLQIVTGGTKGIEFYENEIVSRDGSRHYIAWNISYIFDEHGNIASVLSSGSDRTTQHLTEQELQFSLHELRTSHKQLQETQSQLAQSEKMASIGQLTSGIAHEINNPINFITTSLHGLGINLEELYELIEMYHDITPENMQELLAQIEEKKNELEFDNFINETRDIINLAKNGAMRTIEIVKALRAFSRLDEADQKACDIHQGIDTTLLILQNQWKDRVNVRKEYTELPAVICMPGKLNQVFINILSNAIHAVLLSKKTEKIIWITTSLVNRHSAKFIRISIRDNGYGIPPEKITKVFDPFFTTKPLGEGTGLGLSISMGIIKEHHGYIEVESQEGSGTEFRIDIPFIKEN